MEDIPVQTDPNTPVASQTPQINNPEVIVQPMPSATNLATPPALPTNSMWDAFEHILLFISLYVMAMSIALILHFFTDKWLPGIPVNQSYSSVMSSLQEVFLRGYLAALIVSTPLFSFFFLMAMKRTHANPNIKNLRSRKILIYITLVVTFLIMLSNIIVLVFDFLSGNVTMNFFVHFLITGLVSGVIFYYYLLQVLSDRKQHA